ncbi:MAG: hypothetical protein AB7G47_05570 [Mycolicibacterium sp.]|uniref:hypothetical protein n=1 Tax=Mycolicibacterium sp. TaxID=2320850 RepID=UPI003D0EA4D5
MRAPVVMIWPPFARRWRRVFAGCAIACAIGVASASTAYADPQNPGDPAATACREFARSLDLAAAYYSEFANALAIGEVDPNFRDPIVRTSNVTGRTALRLAATDAFNASMTPGLSTEVATPMRSWSYGSTKLLVLMGMRAGVERINNAATELNGDAHRAQMACALAGTQA